MSKRNSYAPGRKGTDRLIIALILPGLLCAMLLAVGRHKLESRNKAVELTLDYAEIQNLSVSSGTPIPQLLERFKGVGVTGVSVSEDLLGDLVATGQASYIQQPSKTGPVTLILVSNKRHAERMLAALKARLSPSMLSAAVSEKPVGSKESPYSFVVQASPASLNAVGLGLSPETVQLVKGEGLDVVARLQNHPALTASAVDAAVTNLKHDHVERVICSGEEVYGYRGLIPYVADRFQNAGLYYGTIEFGKQKGDQSLSEKLHSDLIRVHSIASAEMATMTQGGAVERFVRAAKERNIRLCYVRLLETSGENPVESSVGFVSTISKQLRHGGFTMAPAHPYGENSRRTRTLLMLIALSIAAATVLLIDSTLGISARARYGALLGCLLVSAVLVMAHEKGLQMLALWGALVFPTLGVVALVGPYFNSETCEKQPIGKALRLFIGSSAVSLCGALVVVGLLADRSYMVKVDQFMGIKAAHGLPLLFVLLMMVTGLPTFGKTLSKIGRDAWQNLRRLASQPLFIWHVFAVVFAVGIVGFALMRTGNDPGVGVSGFELKIRAILDKLLVVRPRTKEFLIGHPALILGIAFLLNRRRNWGLPLVALGMLGQVSLVNTFCHIHTPLGMSIIRIFNGLVLGIIISLLAWWAIGRSSNASSSDKA